jgi:hypothetical protein
MYKILPLTRMFNSEQHVTLKKQYIKTHDTSMFKILSLTRMFNSEQHVTLKKQ